MIPNETGSAFDDALSASIACFEGSSDSLNMGRGPLSRSTGGLIPETFEASGLRDYTVVNDNIITRKEVKQAYKAWTNALVDISQTYANDGLIAAESLAEGVIDAAYAYNLGPVAFKPTWAEGMTTFRPTSEGALSYFVGGNNAYDDLGFGIGTHPPEDDCITGERSPWVKAKFKPAVIRLDGDTATAQGFLHTYGEDGYHGFVDKTFAYQKDDNGDLRLIAHHSSKNYDPNFDASDLDKPKLEVVKNQDFKRANKITLDDVEMAQDRWVGALVSISQTYKDKGYKAARKESRSVIDLAYAYQNGAVAFKPTWTTGNTTFRTDKRGAMSYFVGAVNDNGKTIYDKYPGDIGFAKGSNNPGKSRSPWEFSWYENSVVRLNGDTATTMGWVYFQDEAGDTSKVDKTFEFMKDDDGEIKLVTHHSSSLYESPCTDS